MRTSLLSACVLLIACQGTPASGAADPTPVPKRVRCAAAQSALRKDVIEVRGTVAPPPDRDAQVAPQVAGRVLEINVHEGDRVRAGHAIGRIDDAPLRDAAHQADAALARARAEYLNAQTTLARLQHVFERGIAPKQEVDDAAAREASAQAAQAETEAASRQAHRQIDRAVVRSPLDGIVLKVFKRQGELVDGTPATPLLEVADTSELELVADVPAQDLVRLAPHAPAAIVFPALPSQAWSGQVSRVAPAVDRTTGVGAVRVAIAHDDRTPPPIGIFAAAQVETGELHPVTLVPQVALRAQNGNDGDVVVCGDDRKLHVRKVHVGVAQNALTVVSGELAPNERVAVEPVLGLSEGDAFEAMP